MLTNVGEKENAHPNANTSANTNTQNAIAKRHINELIITNAEKKAPVQKHIKVKITPHVGQVKDIVKKD